MSKVSTATLKSYFKTGDTPTEANFINVFDTLKNLDDASWDVDITGVLDSSSKLQTIFNDANDGDTIFLPRGIIYVNTSVSITKKIKIVGQGTIVKITSSIKAFSLDIDGVFIQNLWFKYFTGTKNSSQYGIFVNSKNDFKINNCSFEGLYHGIGFESTILTGSFVPSEITNCYFLSNTVGISGGVRGEYVNINNCRGNLNTTHIEFQGGNINISSCILTAGVDGIKVMSGANDSHGTISGSFINHLSGNCLLFSSITNGHIVDSCNFFGGTIFLQNCTGVSLQNCRIDVANVLFENAVGSVFMSNRHSSGNTNTINKSYNGAPASTVVSSSNYNLNGTSYAGI